MQRIWPWGILRLDRLQDDSTTEHNGSFFGQGGGLPGIANGQGHDLTSTTEASFFGTEKVFLLAILVLRPAVIPHHVLDAEITVSGAAKGIEGSFLA